MIKDYNKRIINCALQKDFAFIQTVLDKKVDMDFLNEALS